MNPYSLRAKKLAEDNVKQIETLITLLEKKIVSKPMQIKTTLPPKTETLEYENFFVIREVS